MWTAAGRNLAGTWCVPMLSCATSHTSSLALWHQKRRMQSDLQLSGKASGLNHGGLYFQMFVVLL